ncbi:TPA: hypothetical protein SMT72_002133 [Proteus mirabilis]|uniref:MltR family transcriptional regulator n=1 Tax=Proteus mirabilis TaxID=584 RepID=UPI001917D723|nr:MltR family transcriptional regulator [Proteus mirabilis]EKW0400949.1 hypothetical protein [Proteus mirabilis]EKW4512801.1 hypothetical protein [Proteus mirabilis]QQT48461.1 hypothetical protein I6I36_12675 [Proteus mirabilis]HDU8437609.1 hypothetical protein [Proteus mirabilis]HEK2750151.1 hypothetical protein [Proteus mirabilis]
MNKDPEINELSIFLNELHEESDRGIALLSASIIEDWLSTILKSFLIDNEASKKMLDGFNAPIGTFSAKINMAFSLGLIMKNEYKEIEIIRKIRNEFGHNWHGISFKTQKIIDLTNNLPWLGPGDIEQTVKSRFKFCVTILLTDLLWRNRLVSKEKITPKIWGNTTRKHFSKNEEE